MLRNLLARFRPNGRTLPAGCEHIQSRLLPYLDLDLNPAERSLVESHLEHCGTCRAEMAAFRRVETVLGTAAATIPSPGDLRTEFYARLEQSRRRKGISPWLLTAPALTVAAALLFVWVHPGRSVVPTHGPQVSSPVAALTDSTQGTAHSGSHRAVANAGRSEHSPFRGASIKPQPTRLRLPHSQESLMAVSGRQRRAFDFSGHSIKNVHKQATLVAAVSRIHSGTASLSYSRGSSMVDAPLALYTAPVQREDERIADESRGTPLGYRAAGRVTLTSLVTELHVSDENRDFMSSTHIDSAASRKDKDRVETLRIDDDNDNAQEATELPALP